MIWAVAGIVTVLVGVTAAVAALSLRVGKLTRERDEARAGVVRERERAEDAIDEIGKQKRAWSAELRAINAQARQWRDKWIERIPDTPDGRAVAGTELDAAFSRVGRMLREVAPDRATDSDTRSELSRGRDGSSD